MSISVIEESLSQMREAAERGDYGLVEDNYKLALSQANTAFGTDQAPIVLLLLCMHAEAFHRRVREIITERGRLLRVTEPDE